MTRVHASMLWQFVTPTLRSPEHRPIHAFLRSLAISVPHSRSITTAIHLNAQDGAVVTYGQASSATVAGTGRRRGERDGGQQSCPLCWPYECPQVSLSSGAAHSYFGAALSSQNKEKKTILRIYGIEGEAGREGEGRTRIYLHLRIKSSPEGQARGMLPCNSPPQETPMDPNETAFMHIICDYVFM